MTDVKKLAEKCLELSSVQIGEEKNCKCHRIIHIMDMNGKSHHQLQMSENQAVWFKDNIQYIFPAKNFQDYR